MQGTMPGARSRGRPCMAWMYNIKMWIGLTMEESIRMTEFGQQEISCSPAMDHQHEAQPRCPGRDVAGRCVEPVADCVHSTWLRVRGERTALRKQLDNVDKSRRHLPVLRAVAARTDHPAARFSTFKVVAAFIHRIRFNTNVIVIYRPGSCNVTQSFFNDFCDLLERLSTFSVPLMIISDFNIHVDDTTDLSRQKIQIWYTD